MVGADLPTPQPPTTTAPASQPARPPPAAPVLGPARGRVRPAGLRRAADGRPRRGAGGVPPQAWRSWRTTGSRGEGALLHRSPHHLPNAASKAALPPYRGLKIDT